MQIQAPPLSPQSQQLDLSRLTPEERDQLLKLAQEREQRQLESLNLWEPQPEQERFHQSTASERVLRGGWQSGKSLCASVEFARAALGRDPFGKYPTGRPLSMWIICWEEDNIGRTIYRMLFKPGAFQIIKDLKTGLMRSFRPWDPEDNARRLEAVEAPPLIPPRYYNIRDWAWENKGKRIFGIARLLNGAEIYTFNSGGAAPTGDPADVVWIDEDLQYEEHLKELEARLSVRQGRLFWSAKPRSRNNALLDLTERARAQIAWPQPDVEEFQLVFSRNPYITEDEKRKRMDGWTEDEKAALDYGEFTNATALFYPNFHVDIQGIPHECDMYGVPLPDQPELIDRMLIHRQIPPDWTRYMAVDPGQQVCAVLFAAVPPPHLGEYVIAYDELYLMNCDPVKFGKEVAKKATSQSFRAFIIDDHEGRKRTSGMIGGLNVRQQYSKQLREHGIRSEVTGYGFIPGNEDVAGGTSLVKTAMNVRDDGTTYFRVLRGMCLHLERSLSRYRKKVINGVVTDEPARGDNHLADTVRYLLGYKPKWHKPLPAPKEASPRHAWFMRMGKEAKRRGKRRPGSAILLGPGTY